MKIFVDDTVLLTLQTYKDISAYSVFRIKYEDPDGETGFWNAALSPDSDYNIIASISFGTKGTWKVQAFVSGGGEQYHGMWDEIKVYAPLDV